MPFAFLKLKSTPPYRRDAFAAGLAAAGYSVIDALPGAARAGDVGLIWNRYGRADVEAGMAERAGAIVYIAENGYIGSDAEGGQLYALSIGRHNGAGIWTPGDARRLSRQNVSLRDWRRDGEHILVLPQRGIGSVGVAMPTAWPRMVEESLKRRTGRPVRVRPHPGARPPRISLEQDLHGAWAVVTWGSGAAIKALALGYPAFHAMPGWIGSSAALPFDADLEAPWLGDRTAMFERLSGAQASLEEIMSGEAFRRFSAC